MNALTSYITLAVNDDDLRYVSDCIPGRISSGLYSNYADNAHSKDLTQG